MYMMTVTLGLSLVVVAIITSPCWAYGRGAPMHACRTLIPMHGPDAQTSESPYMLSVLEETSPEANKVRTKVTLSGLDPFLGFIVQSRNSSNSRQLVGSFVQLPEATSSVRCDRTNPTSTITHTNPKPKERLELTWEADITQTPVLFKASFVKDFDTFWVDHEVLFEPKILPRTTEHLTSAEPKVTDKATSGGGAKNNASKAKHTPTGGGKKDQEPTPTEEAVIRSVEGRPTLEGVTMETGHEQQEEDVFFTTPLSLDDNGFLTRGETEISMNEPTTSNLQPTQAQQAVDEGVEGTSQDIEETFQDTPAIGCSPMTKKTSNDVLYGEYLEQATKTMAIQERVLLLKEKKLQKELELLN